MGKIIVIEGLDASGKGTQSEILKDRLNKDGKEALKVSFPNYADDSSSLVKMYLSGQFGDKPDDVNAYAASSFYAVDRYASYKKFWGSKYEEGKIIVADRYTSSNAVHQMTKLDHSQWDEYLNWLFNFEHEKLGIPKADLVIFLDMPVEVSQKLLLKRYENNEAKKDMHEKDRKYLLSCYKSANYACRKLGWHRIECAVNGEPRSIEDISEEISDVVERKLFND